MARKRRNKRGEKEEEMQKELNIPKGRKNIKIKERRDKGKVVLLLSLQTAATDTIQLHVFFLL